MTMRKDSKSASRGGSMTDAINYYAGLGGLLVTREIGASLFLHLLRHHQSAVQGRTACHVIDQSIAMGN